MSDKLDWDVALIGYDPTQRARYLDAIIDARQSGGPEPEMDCGRRKTDLEGDTFIFVSLTCAPASVVTVR